MVCSSKLGYYTHLAHIHTRHGSSYRMTYTPCSFTKLQRLYQAKKVIEKGHYFMCDGGHGKMARLGHRCACGSSALATPSVCMAMPLSFPVLQGVHPTVVRDGATGVHLARAPRQPGQRNHVAALQVLHGKVTTSMIYCSPKSCTVCVAAWAMMSAATYDMVFSTTCGSR